MSFKSMVREMRDGIGNISKRKPLGQHFRNRGRSHIAPEIDPSSYALIEQTQWANLPPELLLDIIHRLEASETTWPARRDVVACAAVCKSWRDVTKELVKTPEKCGWLTFPISLKQPGPREYPIQCFIKRERGTSTYQLYLGLSPALSGDMNKMLLAAKKIRRATTTDFVISLAGDDFSRTSTAYIGKLRSNFLGTKFTVFDTQPPGHDDSATNKPNQRLYSKHTPLNYKMVSVSYELNVLRTRGPRRMQCAMHSIPVSSIQEGGTAPTPTELRKCLDEDYPHLAVPKEKKKTPVDFSSTNHVEPVYEEAKEPLSLKNKAPRWHEQLQCWCLNFKGRVTVASVKNFQLVAAVDVGQNVSAEEQEKVILQFGKIGKDIFTMDYRYPLSAFQAFAICLSSFDTKPACE